jgi:hypothetical protein
MNQGQVPKDRSVTAEVPLGLIVIPVSPRDSRGLEGDDLSPQQPHFGVDETPDHQSARE